MLLYIIRHGDPIYGPDTLTEKGQLQARALAARLAVNGLDRIYSSPMGRARETAQPTCDKLGLQYSVEEWTSEKAAWQDFTTTMPDGRRTWCFSVQGTLLKNDDTINVVSDWHELEIIKRTNAKAGYKRIQDSSDDFLARHGYLRSGTIYSITRPNDEKIAVFCHEGFGLTWMSHLLSIPPHIFWTSFKITHSGVSIFNFRNNPDGCTIPECLCLNDVSHIYKSGLPMQINNSIDI